MREDIREGARGLEEEGKKREIAACMQKERFLNKLLREERRGVAPFCGTETEMTSGGLDGEVCSELIAVRVARR